MLRRVRRLRFFGIPWLAGGIAAVVLALVIAWVLSVPAADWLARHDVGSAKGLLLQTARDAARGRLLTLGAGLLAAGALLFTARNFTLSREGQVTDRYTKAIEQLGSQKLDVRIGGIYALERVAGDSARDHPTVMAVLSAFVREHSREHWPPPEPEPAIAEPMRSPRPDVQAAVTVIGRRDPRRDNRRRSINLSRAYLAGADLDDARLGFSVLTRADLTRADLARADLARADLTRADLTRANLTRANLTRANLLRANLTRANLDGANFSSAYLNGANFGGAYLAGANFGGAYLAGANFGSANLVGANLTQADLAGAHNLGRAVLDGADLTGARWPGDAPVPALWKLDTGSGRLERAGTDSGPTEAS